MFSSLHGLFIKFIGIDQITDRLDTLEHQLIELEHYQKDYRAIQFYIDEAERMYQEDLVKLQEDIHEAILLHVEPLGDA
jgi:hypothetical protein